MEVTSTDLGDNRPRATARGSSRRPGRYRGRRPERERIARRPAVGGDLRYVTPVPAHLDRGRGVIDQHAARVPHRRDVEVVEEGAQLRGRLLAREHLGTHGTAAIAQPPDSSE